MTFDLQIKQKNGWAGKVVVEIPRHPERMAMLAKAKAHRYTDGEGLKGKEMTEAFLETNLPILTMAYEEAARKLVKEVHLAGPNGEKVTTIDEVETHPELENVWIGIASQYLIGYGPGKKKNQN